MTVFFPIKSKIFSTPVLRGFDSEFANKTLNLGYLNLLNFGRQRLGNAELRKSNASTQTQYPYKGKSHEGFPTAWTNKSSRTSHGWTSFSHRAQKGKAACNTPDDLVTNNFTSLDNNKVSVNAHATTHVSSTFRQLDPTSNGFGYSS